MKRLALTAASVVLAFSFVGCTAPLDHGTVTAKHYTPAADWDTTGGYAYTCMPGYDMKMDCKYKYSPFITEHHHRDACYELDFEADGRTGSECVAPSDYDSIHVGDLWGPQ